MVIGSGWPSFLLFVYVCKSVADLGGPPQGPKFSQFHAVFRKIWQNHMLALPPWRVGAPSYGESCIRPCKWVAGKKPLLITISAVAWTQAQVVNSNSTSTGKETPLDTVLYGGSLLYFRSYTRQSHGTAVSPEAGGFVNPAVIFFDETPTVLFTKLPDCLPLAVMVSETVHFFSSAIHKAASFLVTGHSLQNRKNAASRNTLQRLFPYSRLNRFSGIVPVKSWNSR